MRPAIRFTTVERLEEVARNALLGGYGRVVLSKDGKYRRVIELMTSNSCEHPFAFELHARYSAQHGKRVKPIMIRGTSRCRKCEACMNYKSWHWRERAIAEFKGHPMTLFGTITMSPEQHYLLDAEIASGTDKRPARDIRALTADELFACRVRAFGTRVTDFLKRVREGRGGEKPTLRYLLVAEAHDGARTSEGMRMRPHFHIMLHTSTPSVLVKGRPGESGMEWHTTKDGCIYVDDNAWLRKHWSYGFTKFELARDERAAWYVCKYISKALTCRVRASQGYGSVPEMEWKSTLSGGKVGCYDPIRLL